MSLRPPRSATGLEQSLNFYKDTELAILVSAAGLSDQKILIFTSENFDANIANSVSL